MKKMKNVRMCESYEDVRAKRCLILREVGGSIVAEEYHDDDKEELAKWDNMVTLTDDELEETIRVVRQQVGERRIIYVEKGLVFDGFDGDKIVKKHHHQLVESTDQALFELAHKRGEI